MSSLGRRPSAAHVPAERERPGFMAAMCVAEPAPTQTVSWASRFWSIRTRSTLGSGKGATEPGAKPVASSTSAPRATRASIAPAACATFARSTRRSPGTSTTTGRPSQRTTIDLTIWPIGQPAARAASSAVAVPDSSSSSLASAPAARRSASDPLDGLGPVQAHAESVPVGGAPERGDSSVVSSTSELPEAKEREIAREVETESLFREVNERIAESAERFDADETKFVVRVRRPDVHRTGSRRRSRSTSASGRTARPSCWSTGTRTSGSKRSCGRRRPRRRREAAPARGSVRPQAQPARDLDNPREPGL